jgi:hypothetical protein
MGLPYNAQLKSESPSRKCTAGHKERSGDPQRLDTNARGKEVGCTDCDLLFSFTNRFLACAHNHALSLPCTFLYRLPDFGPAYVNAKALIEAYRLVHISSRLHYGI